MNIRDTLYPEASDSIGLLQALAEALHHFLHQGLDGQKIVKNIGKTLGKPKKHGLFFQFFPVMQKSQKSRVLEVLEVLDMVLG